MNRPTLRLNDGYSTQNFLHRPYVRQLQGFLRILGYGVVVDGLFGQKTQDAVKRFQRSRSLLVDGVVGPITWEALVAATVSNSGTGSLDMNFPTTLPFGSPTLQAQEVEAEKYRIYIEGAARRYNFPVAVIAGIGSRESGWGRALRPRTPAGTGDRAPRAPKNSIGRTGNLPPDGGGFGRGLMQIDYDWHTFARGEEWKDPRKNIDYAIGRVLYPNRKYLKRKTNLDGKKLLLATLASYNAGAYNVYRAVREGKSADIVTTGRDYGKDVLNRAGWFFQHGWQ